MNAVHLIGRLTRDPEVRKTQNDITVATFTLAVDRRTTDSNGNRQADFLPCVAWRGAGDFVGRWFKKGMRVAVSGSIQTRSYDAKDGAHRTVTEIICDNVEFCESKQETAAPAQTAPANTFTEVEDDSLPF